MSRQPVARGRAYQEISETHARGLRRDLFRAHSLRIGPKAPLLVQRLRAVQWPYPSPREALQVYVRTRRLLRECSDYFTERRTDEGGTDSCGILLLPSRRRHADGDEPVLSVVQVIITVQAGRISVGSTRWGRISHHAVERMYQRLRTASHDEVMDELRGALRWVALLGSAAWLSRRGATINQLVVPTTRGALRCIRDPELGELEVRTFTLHRPDDRVAATIRSLHAWAEAPGTCRAAFPALLRDPVNRWWREPYRPDGRSRSDGCR